MTTIYCGIDVETTGTNPERDALAQVAVTLFTIDDDTLTATTVASTTHTIGTTAAQWAAAAPGAYRVNLASGVMAASIGHTTTTAYADAALVAFMAQHTGPRDNVVMFGSGIGHIDRPFVLANLPGFAQWITAFWLIDGGVVRRTLRMALGAERLASLMAEEGAADAADQSTKTHRATDDIAQHIAEYCAMLRIMRRYMGTGPDGDGPTGPAPRGATVPGQEPRTGPMLHPLPAGMPSDYPDGGATAKGKVITPMTDVCLNTLRDTLRNNDTV